MDMVKSLALKNAQKRYYEKNKEVLRERNNINNKLRYQMDDEYSEKIKLMALASYYEKMK
jgi:hypothetical protein